MRAGLDIETVRAWLGDAGMTGGRTEVVVVGGGVMGSSIAYHLARRGVAVTLLERGDIPCAASAASAGGVRQQGRDLREMPLAVASIARWEHLEDELEADLHYRREGHLTVSEDADSLDELEPWMAAQQALGLDIRLVEGDDLRELIPGVAPSKIIPCASLPQRLCGKRFRMSARVASASAR